MHFSKISYFLLLLDEADAFIESCMEINYTPIIALKNIQTEVWVLWRLVFRNRLLLKNY